MPFTTTISTLKPAHPRPSRPTSTQHILDHYNTPSPPDTNIPYTIDFPAMISSLISDLPPSLHQSRALHASTLLPPPPRNPNPLGAIGERHPKPPSPTPFAIAAIEHNDNEAIRNAPAFKNARREPPAAAFTSRRETGKSHGINDTANSVPTPNANDNNNRASENHSLKAAQRARTSTSTSTSASPFTSNNDNDDNDPISDLHARWIAAYKQHTGSEEWLLKARAHAAAARTDAVARVADEIRWLKWRINGGVGRAERAGMQERLEVLLAVQRGRV